MNCTIRVEKTKALISFAVTAKLICVFVFAYADCWFSCAGAHSYIFLSHLLIAGCDIGVQISVQSKFLSIRACVRPSIRPSTFTSKFGFLDIRDSCKSETLHSNCP